MDSDISLRDKGGNLDVVVEIRTPKSDDENSKENGDSQSKDDDSVQLKMNLFNAAAAAATAPNQPAPPPAQLIIPAPTSDPAAKPPIGPAMRRRTLTKSAYSKPKSRIAEPPYPSSLKPADQTAPTASAANSPIVASSPSLKPNPVATPKTSAPITPKTPLMAPEGDEEEEDDDNDDDVYNTDNLKPAHAKRGKKLKAMFVCEWIIFVGITAVLISSKTVEKLKGKEIWSLELWKWCVLVLVIFCGRLFTEWFTNFLVFLIERNFLLKKKVLYFLFGLKKSVRIVIWLALILLAWALLINRGVQRTEEETKILNKITRGIVATLVGAVLWMVKTLLVKLVASNFHVKTFFDRIQESIFHQYILQALSGTPDFDNADGRESLKSSGRLSFKKMKTMKIGKVEQKGEDVINVDKLYKIKREKVSAWTMRGLMNVIRDSDLLTVSDVLDESVEEEESGGKKVITSEVEAREAGNRIFKRVVKPGHK